MHILFFDYVIFILMIHSNILVFINSYNKSLIF